MAGRFDEELLRQALGSLLSRLLPSQSLEREGSAFVVTSLDFDHGAMLGPQKFVREDLANGTKDTFWLYPVYMCDSCGTRYSSHKWDASKVPVQLAAGCGHPVCPSCRLPMQYCDNCKLSFCWRCIHYFENGPLREYLLCHDCAVDLLKHADQLGLTRRW